MDNLNLKILGLESSCDDTAAAIIDSKHTILSNVVITQDQEHVLYQGVVPEIAARSHLTNIKRAIDQTLIESNLSFSDIDAVAATCGPGLIGGVIVGSMYGKALSSTLQKPFIAVNHLEGHALTARFTDNIDFPYLLLLVSGGHCQFVFVESLGKYKILGQTLDDAVGEAFDKVAKTMGLGFPGGPIIERLAVNGDPHRFNFPRPIINQKNSNMSFSGLKTAVKMQVDALGAVKIKDIHDIAASFQEAICDILVIKTKFAIKQYEELGNKLSSSKQLIVSGGAAANKRIRAKLDGLCQSIGYNFVAPPIKLCTDNAVMIAFAGLERLRNGIINDMSFCPRARWSLEELS